MYPVTLDSATASDWTTTPSNATLLEALSEPGTVPTTKIATSAVTKGLLTASLKSSIPANVSISALELVTGARAGGASAAKIGTKLSLGGTDTAELVQSVQATTYNYNVGLGVFHKDPLGASWTPANIDSTNLVLQPDA